MTEIEDVAKSNEEVEEKFKKWYEEWVVQPVIDWLIKEVGAHWLKARKDSSYFYSMLCFILLGNENRELIFEYDDYVEKFRRLNQDFPNGFTVHAYVKDDKKFHIWLEENESPDALYDNLFGSDVEIGENE